MVSKSNEEGTLDISNVYYKTSRGASLLSFSLYSTLMIFGMFAVSFLDPNHISIYMFMTLFMIIGYHFNIMTSTAYAILIGLGELKDVIISHLISTVINVVLYIVLKNILTDSIILLPVSASIVLSSIYLIYAFRKKVMATYESKKITDFYIRSLGVITVVLSVMAVIIHVNKWVLLGIIIIHSLTMLYFMYKNDFFQMLIRRILNLKN
jgi:O-antigen/teichoic acid export membrane protein